MTDIHRDRISDGMRRAHETRAAAREVLASMVMSRLREDNDDER